MKSKKFVIYAKKDLILNKKYYKGRDHIYHFETLQIDYHQDLIMGLKWI